MPWIVETHEFYIGWEGISEDTGHWILTAAFDTKEKADQHVKTIQNNKPWINPLNPVPGRSTIIKATTPIEVVGQG